MTPDMQHPTPVPGQPHSAASLAVDDAADRAILDAVWRAYCAHEAASYRALGDAAGLSHTAAANRVSKLLVRGWLAFDADGALVPGGYHNRIMVDVASWTVITAERDYRDVFWFIDAIHPRPRLFAWPGGEFLMFAQWPSVQAVIRAGAVTRRIALRDAAMRWRVLEAYATPPAAAIADEAVAQVCYRELVWLPSPLPRGVARWPVVGFVWLPGML